MGNFEKSINRRLYWGARSQFFKMKPPHVVLGGEKMCFEKIKIVARNFETQISSFWKNKNYLRNLHARSAGFWKNKIVGKNLMHKSPTLKKNAKRRLKKIKCDVGGFWGRNADLWKYKTKMFWGVVLPVKQNDRSLSKYKKLCVSELKHDRKNKRQDKEAAYSMTGEVWANRCLQTRCKHTQLKK